MRKPGFVPELLATFVGTTTFEIGGVAAVTLTLAELDGVEFVLAGDA